MDNLTFAEINPDMLNAIYNIYKEECIYVVDDINIYSNFLKYMFWDFHGPKDGTAITPPDLVDIEKQILKIEDAIHAQHGPSMSFMTEIVKTTDYAIQTVLADCDE